MLHLQIVQSLVQLSDAKNLIYAKIIRHSCKDIAFVDMVFSSLHLHVKILADIEAACQGFFIPTLKLRGFRSMKPLHSRVEYLCRLESLLG